MTTANYIVEFVIYTAAPFGDCYEKHFNFEDEHKAMEYYGSKKDARAVRAIGYWDDKCKAYVFSPENEETLCSKGLFA